MDRVLMGQGKPIDDLEFTKVATAKPSGLLQSLVRYGEKYNQTEKENWSESHYSSMLKSVIRTAIMSSTSTISPNATSEPPA